VERGGGSKNLFSSDGTFFFHRIYEKKVLNLGKIMKKIGTFDIGHMQRGTGNVKNYSFQKLNVEFIILLKKNDESAENSYEGLTRGGGGSKIQFSLWNIFPVEYIM
jgi:hypothetical protein